MEKLNLVIVGAGETADIAFEYFTYDSHYSVSAFVVEKEFRKEDSRYGLPVIDIEDMIKIYPPDRYLAFVAISYTQLNRLRERLFNQVKMEGYECATYISSRAFVWRTALIGENCMIFENNVIQHGVIIEDNVILWSGNHIGHQTRIKKSCYISSHVVISGYCEIGKRSFLGVNSTISNNLNIAEDCLIGAGSVVVKNTEIGGIYIGNPALKREGLSSLKYFKVNSRYDE